MAINLFKHIDLTDQGLRYFGLSLLTIIGAWSGLMHWRWGLVFLPLCSSVLGLLFAIVYFGFPTTRRGIHRAFVRITSPVQIALTVVVLGVFFFAVFFPLGVVLRFFGKGVRQNAPNANTYWTPRQEPVELKRYFDTF